MHPTPLVKEPGGTSKVVAWFRKLRKNILERTLIAGSGVNLDYTQDGTRISIGALRRAAAKGGEGINFRGDWDHTTVYSPNDYVFFAQSYAVEAYKDASYEFSGLWKCKLTTETAVAPGTDSDYWERVAEGPRDGEIIKATGSDQEMTLRASGVYVDLNQMVFAATDSSWQISAIAGDDGTLSVASGDFDGAMIVREIHLAQGGILLKSKLIMTEPEAVDVSDL